MFAIVMRDPAAGCKRDGQKEYLKVLKQRETAQNLKNAGISVPVIAENTGLTQEEVEMLYEKQQYCEVRRGMWKIITGRG